MKQEELEQANQELEDTNRGVLALYAEINEKSSNVRAESEARSQFFSGVSHELRTPINSVLALTRLLLGRADGDLTAEQERQVIYIKTASETLSNLINDLLDLSKVQAGKLTPNITEFTVEEVFSAFRGTGYQVIQARTLKQAAELLGSMKPQTVILDILLEREIGWDFLQWLKKNPGTADVPVVVISVTDDREKVFLWARTITALSRLTVTGC